MEAQEILEKPIGTIEQTKLQPKPLKIVSVVIKTKTKEDKEMKTPLAIFMCKHPDSEELIKISKVKSIKEDKVSVVSTWVQLDKDENIQKSSAVDMVLTKLNCKNLAETYSKEIDSVFESDSSPYLCLKLY